MSYSTLISKTAARLGHPGADPAHLEAWMRVEHGTLDSLSPAQFEREVGIAIECARAASPVDNQALAGSLGLIPRT